MEYAITFSDGSTAVLVHHGVKGMHWGQRNAETQMKYAGGQGRKQRRADIREIRRKGSNTGYDQASRYLKKNNDISAARKAGKMTKDQARAARIKNADKYEKDFYATRAKNRTEIAKIKSEGKSARAQGRIMGKAEYKNVYEKTSSKGASYGRHQSRGKNVAKAVLLGYSGSRSYNSARAAGETRAKAALYGLAGSTTGNPNIDWYADAKGTKAKKATKAKYKK